MNLDLTAIVIILAAINVVQAALNIFLGYKIYSNGLRWFKVLEMERAKHQESLARSKSTQRAVHVGAAAEKFAPILPGFPLLPTEVRFFGSPIDYIGFADLEDELKEVWIYFIEVKSGRYSKLNDRQWRIKQAVDAGRVRWVTYRVGEDIAE